jgi:asparagine synthase (glutamine-hydrolysing)
LGGYPRHVAERWYPFARHLGGLLRLLPEQITASDRLLRVRRLVAEPDRAARFTELLAVFSPAEAIRLTRLNLDPESLSAPVRRWLEPQAEVDSVNALLRVDARLSLADDLLIVADAMSMAASVELRVPFLDLELLALLEAMPSRFKISRLGERKWLYRRAVAPLLPNTIQSALVGWRARTGRKLGFTTPLDAWYAAWLQREATTYLTGDDARLPMFVDPHQIGRIIAEARRASARRHRQVLALFVLETWLRSAVQ